MYQLNNKIYADAGFILKYDNTLAYSFRDVDANSVSEIEVKLDDMVRKGNRVRYSNGLLMDYASDNYGELKKKLVNKQFTNDDQIAIILNKEASAEDAMLFEKMQEWRTWSGVVAKKIVEVTKG